MTTSATDRQKGIQVRVVCQEEALISLHQTSHAI